MATRTIARNPLATKSYSTQQGTASAPSLQAARKASSAKRAHSPELLVENGQGNSSKRAKATPDAAASVQDRKSRRVEREQEFRDKYSRAFPTWTFYFDVDCVTPAEKDVLVKRVTNMGAGVDDFFSREITHVVSLAPTGKPGNKENVSKGRGGQGGSTQVLDSPIRLRPRTANNGTSELIQKALSFDLKVWSPEKLRSVLDRSEPLNWSSHSISGAVSHNAPALEALLKAEKLTGTTERDPTQRRHDFIYFEKGSYFILVEDMKQELATIVALQYLTKSRDGKDKFPYPFPYPYCDPRARGPFLPYDEREERRRERQERVDHERQLESRRRKFRLLERAREMRKQLEEEARVRGELRRTQSMSNLRRRATFHGRSATEATDEFERVYDDEDCEIPESAAASGYLASHAYTAASGNSVSITSNTATTSTGGLQPRTSLPPVLLDKLHHEVVTSRKTAGAPQRKHDNTMGPPPVPDKQRMLRKSRSTNTMRLPKRDEATKPGYCESCRQKFADFKEHVKGRRHRKYATDDANFANLDIVLGRLRRHTQVEVEADEFAYQPSPRFEQEQLHSRCSSIAPLNEDEAEEFIALDSDSDYE